MMTLDEIRRPITDRADVGGLRRTLVDDLRALGLDGGAYDAGVMVSELIANVLEHTDSVALVDVEVGERAVKVLVFDESDELPVVRPVDPHRIGGNGMRVVATFAEAWGVDVDPRGGKTVWFTVPRAA